MAAGYTAPPLAGASAGGAQQAYTAGAPTRSPGNVLGRVTCLTLFTPIRPQWVWFLRVGFWLTRYMAWARRGITQFDFIHFVRWAVVKRMPYNGPPQQRESLNYQYLLFESNFDGPWQHYIDAFAYCIPLNIRVVWGRGIAFPAPPPAEPLKRWIAANSMEGGSYYCAYPNASTRVVQSALVVRDALDELVRKSRALAPEEFRREYERFLTGVQAHL